MSNELPESNNVYSSIASPVNLKLAEKLLKEEFPDARVWIKTSGYNGAKSLHIRSEIADFEGYPESEVAYPSYLFNGGLAGDDSVVASRVSSLYKRFHDAGLQFSIEAYDSANGLICEFPEKPRVVE